MAPAGVSALFWYPQHGLGDGTLGKGRVLSPEDQSVAQFCWRRARPAEPQATPKAWRRPPKSADPNTIRLLVAT